MNNPGDIHNEHNRRILLVDDNQAIHDDFRKILGAGPTAGRDLDAEAALVFDDLPAAGQGTSAFDLDSAMQGQEALELVKKAVAENQPYALAFVDMRMPPGWDGLTTIRRLWEVDPGLQIIICTAYSDRTWEEIQTSLTDRERWLVLKKPFDKIEVLQLAHALTEKWNLGRLASLKMEALERMVEVRTRELENAIRVKNEFLANVSHELLTPMNGICGFLEFLEDTELEEEQLDCVQQARQCGGDLLQLINKVLDFNRLEAGTLKIDTAKFDPLDLVEDVIASEATHSKSQDTEIEVNRGAEPLGEWVGPAEVIRKVLQPLLNNAVKFTPKGRVSLSVQPRTDQLEFTVADTGVGLTPEQLEWLRIPFAKVDGGTKRRSSGIGLGLPLVSKLVKAAGGQFQLNGETNRGAEARFTVPATPAESGPVN